MHLTVDQHLLWHKIPTSNSQDLRGSFLHTPRLSPNKQWKVIIYKLLLNFTEERKYCVLLPTTSYNRMSCHTVNCFPPDIITITGLPALNISCYKIFKSSFKSKTSFPYSILLLLPLHASNQMLPILTLKPSPSGACPCACSSRTTFLVLELLSITIPKLSM